MACQGFFTDRYLVYFDLLFLASALSTIIFFPSGVILIFKLKQRNGSFLTSGQEPSRGDFFSFSANTQSTSALQTSPSPGEVIAAEQMLVISINNSGAL